VKNRDAMRTVRGIDFDDLTKDDLSAISAWLRGQPVAIKKPVPREYQIEALARISETLAKWDRAHVVMACGTGKTLLALWAAEELRPKTVLVLLPSLILLQQALAEWSRHNNWGKDFTYLCVCSDPTVAARDENDAVHLDATDLEFDSALVGWEERVSSARAVQTSTCPAIASVVDLKCRDSGRCSRF
jgi:predicted helicase